VVASLRREGLIEAYLDDASQAQRREARVSVRKIEDGSER